MTRVLDESAFPGTAAGHWQTFIAAPSSTLAGIRTLDTTVQIGAVHLTPTGIIRSEPDLHETDDLAGVVAWQRSSPVSVEGGPDPAPYAPWAGPAAIAQVWRICALLTLDLGVMWWPLGRPWVIEQSGHLGATLGALHRLEPGTAAFLARPPWATDPPPSGTLTESCRVAPREWVGDAWTRLDDNRNLDEVVRTHLNASRLLAMGHLFVEAAILQLIGIFDGLGTGKHPITSAMERSFARHYCPKIRAEPEVAARELFQLTRPGRNEIAHEARLLHLEGVGAGPLGDKPLDLDPSVSRLDVEVVRVLHKQAAYLLKGELGAVSPEPGRCVHS